MWEQFKAGWDAFTNNRWVLSLTGILGSLGAILIILNKTSIGRKALGFLNKAFDNLKNKFEELLIRVSKCEKYIQEKNQEIQEKCSQYQKACENKVSAIYIQYETFKNDIYKILEQIPNAKVQEQLKLVKTEVAEKEEDIKFLLGETYQEINSLLNEGTKEEIANLKGEINQLKEFIKANIKVPVIADLVDETEELTNGEEENSD